MFIYLILVAFEEILYVYYMRAVLAEKTRVVLRHYTHNYKYTYNIGTYYYFFFFCKNRFRVSLCSTTVRGWILIQIYGSTYMYVFKRGGFLIRITRGNKIKIDYTKSYNHFGLLHIMPLQKPKPYGIVIVQYNNNIIIYF